MDLTTTATDQGGTHVAFGIRSQAGRVEGQIHAGQTVIGGEHAEIDASIEARTLEVYGTVVGDIRVARRSPECREDA